MKIVFVVVKCVVVVLGKWMFEFVSVVFSNSLVFNIVDVVGVVEMVGVVEVGFGVEVEGDNWFNVLFRICEVLI